MTEQEYFDATNLAKLRAAQTILRDVLHMDMADDEQLISARVIISEFIESLEKSVRTARITRDSDWLQIDSLPKSDTWAVLILDENFSDSEIPVIAHYCKSRDRFSENGEEVPHAAIVKYKELEV